MIRKFPSHACDRARAQISSRIDEELSELEHARLDLHLAGCAACRAYEADVMAVTNLVRAAPLETLEFPVFVARRRRSASAACSAPSGRPAPRRCSGPRTASGRRTSTRPITSSV